MLRKSHERNELEEKIETQNLFDNLNSFNTEIASLESGSNVTSLENSPEEDKREISEAFIDMRYKQVLFGLPKPENIDSPYGELLGFFENHFQTTPKTVYSTSENQTTVSISGFGMELGSYIHSHEDVAEDTAALRALVFLNEHPEILRGYIEQTMLRRSALVENSLYSVPTSTPTFLSPIANEFSSKNDEDELKKNDENTLKM